MGNRTNRVISSHPPPPTTTTHSPPSLRSTQFPCMAATNSTTTKSLARLGKRFVTSQAPSLSAFRRNVYTSVYDKNIDEHVRPAVVPDNVMQQESDKYWAPHPHTGIFGPVADVSHVGGHERGFHSSRTKASGEVESVLEEKAFFRPLENLEKPQHH